MRYRMPDVTVLAYGGHQPQIAADAFLASGARLIGQLTIAEGASVWFNTVLRADVNYIRIGRLTNIQDHCVVHVTHGGLGTVIGDEVTVGHHAMIHAATVHNGCLIGMGATLLDGVVVGEQSLVAAGALLPPGKTYPPRSLIVGSPATVKRPLTHEELADLKQSAVHYAELRQRYAQMEHS